MGSIAEVRSIISDKAQFAEYQFVGDGSRSVIGLPTAPVVAGSQRVTLGGQVQVEATDYTLDDDTGKLTFTKAPTDGAVVLVTYDHTILSDGDIQTFLTLEDNDNQMAAAMALETIATNQALVLKVIKLQNLSTDGAALSRALLERSKQLREQTAGDFDWAEMVTNEFTFDERIFSQHLREN